VIERGLQATAQLVPDAAKGLELLVVGGATRVGEPPVVTPGLAQEHRALLLRAEGDDRLHVVGRDVVHALRVLVSGVDADLGEHAYGKWIHPRRRGSGRGDLHASRGERPGDALRHLAAGRVGHAEK
jgi:hypothetical protein